MREGNILLNLYFHTSLFLIFNYFFFFKKKKSLNFNRAALEFRRKVFYNIVPYLQAETDILYLADRRRFLRDEEVLMKDEPGWVVGESVYKTRWMPPIRMANK
jgi:NADH dehydrogenase (ubiquinone) 1 alpha subcomplex subunit 13